jgi:hypothetical protein
MGDGAVILLDQQTFDAAPAEIGGQAQADRPAANNQNGDFFHTVPFDSVPTW